MNFEFSYVLVGLMQVVGFFIQGITGFGCTVIAASVTNGLLTPAVGVPYGTILTLPFMYYLGIRGRKEVAWKDLFKIVILCIPGILIGNFLFHKISPQTAKISIGAMICLIALMNIYKHIIKPLILKQVVEEEKPTKGKIIFRYACLILGGIVHGAFTIGGPLITVYTLETIKDKKSFRNTMTWVWCILNVWNAFRQYPTNQALIPALWGSLIIGFPLAAVGFFFGMRFLDKINRVQFLRIVYVILLIIGADMLIRNLF